MRSVMNSVDENFRADRMRHFPGAFYIVDRAKGVRRRSDRNQFSSARYLSRKILPIQFTRFRDHFRHARGHAAFFFQSSPRCDIGMMVQLRDHNLVAARELMGKRAREMKGQRRHVGAENDLRRRRVEKIGQHISRRINDGVGFLACRISPMRVRVVVKKIIVHGFDNHSRDLSSAWSVEIRDGVTAINPLQRGELTAYFGVRYHSFSGRCECVYRYSCLDFGRHDKQAITFFRSEIVSAAIGEEALPGARDRPKPARLVPERPVKSATNHRGLTLLPAYLSSLILNRCSPQSISGLPAHESAEWFVGSGANKERD